MSISRLGVVEIDVEVHKAIESRRTSFSETPNEILRSVLGLNKVATIVPIVVQNIPDEYERLTRSRSVGPYNFTIEGQFFSEGGLTDAYLKCLNIIASNHPEFLAKFSQMNSRARRYIAKNPVELYKNSPHLVDQHAKRFIGDWWIDTNLSQDQVVTRLEDAAQCASLVFGVDLKLDFPKND